MKALKRIKYIIGATTLIVAASAQAVVVDTSLWTTEASPARNLGPAGITSTGGNQVVQNNNTYGTLVSDFSFNSDFSFSGSLTPTTARFNDNDILGVVFGWQDASNHYRLGWEQGGFNDISGASGLFLVRESAGISTILFQQEVFWADNVDYNFVVGRTGNDISFNLGGVSQSFTDTTFTSGNVGLYTESQTARFGGLAASTAVPTPAPLALLGIGLIGIILARKKSAV